MEDGFSERAIFAIDKTGTIRYVDVHDIDQQPDNEVLFDVLNSLETPRAAINPKPLVEEAPVVSPEPEAEVVMYCTPWCPACRRARAYFQENGIEFVEIDITRDRAAAQRVRGWANGYETTPTFKIKGTVIVEFDKTKIAQVLGLQ
jgi:glutaredoxin